MQVVVTFDVSKTIEADLRVRFETENPRGLSFGNWVRQLANARTPEGWVVRAVDVRG